jgi:hypothetical protein
MGPRSYSDQRHGAYAAFQNAVNTPAVIIFSLLGATGFSFAQVEPSPSPSPVEAAITYEELPELKASEILRENVLNGPYHKVREEVIPYSGANHYSIDSHFGVFEAEGNEMLVRRIGEINAIAKLKEVSRTDEYKQALLQAAKGPLAAAKQIVTEPVETISNVPKGIKKFMNRAGQTIKGIGKKQDSDKYEGSQVQQMIGFSDTKRKVALSLGVDPYSSNPVLQHELEEIAWASFAGNATFSLGTLPIGGGAGMALTVTGTQNRLEDILREKSPAELKMMNRKALLAMGASGKEADRFLGNDAFSPTAQTAFLLNLKSLDGVENRRAFIRLAAEISSNEADAIFCVQTAALMSKLHHGEKPLARIALLGDFPICIAKDGSVIVALQWDYAAWTKLASDFEEQIQAQEKDATSRLIAVSGMVSPRLRQELEARGYVVEDRVVPGPLK